MCHPHHPGPPQAKPTSDAANGPRGLVIFSNSDNNAMLLNCTVVKRLLQSTAAFSPPIKCLDWSLTLSFDDFSLDGMKQEEVGDLLSTGWAYLNRMQSEVFPLESGNAEDVEQLPGKALSSVCRGHGAGDPCH